MLIPETGEVVTPADDPCQYDPAWRSSVAGYLFSMGIRTRRDWEFLFRFGRIPVPEEDKDAEKVKKVKGKRHKHKPVHRATDKEKELCQDVKYMRPIPPFDEHAEYRVFAADKWIKAQVKMFNDEVEGKPLSDASVPLRLAMRWYSETESEAAIRKRIEPLLLTGIGMDIIALDLIGKKEARPAFEAYERLYYNCREEDWSLSRSAQLVQRFAMPWGPLKTYLRKYEEVDDDGFVIGDGRPLAKDSDVWRAIAANAGYDALMYAWRWNNRAHGMKQNTLENMIDVSWQIAVSRIYTDLFNGDIKHEDAARVLAAYTAQAKKISDDRNGRSGSEDSDITKALMSVLYQVAPKMVSFTVEDAQARKDEIQSRIQSQLAIEKQVIEDKGKQVEAEIVDAQISSAVEQ